MSDNTVRKKWLKAIEKEKLKLTKQRIEFCWHFVRLNNGTQAAIEAKYSKRGAKEMASFLLTIHNVDRAIELLRIEINKVEGIASPEQTLKGYTADGWFNPKTLFDEDGNLIPIPDLPDEVAICIQGFEVKERILKSKDDDEEIIERRHIYKFPDKLKGKELMGRHHNLFKEDNAGSRLSLKDVVLELLNSLPAETKSVVTKGSAAMLDEILGGKK